MSQLESTRNGSIQIWKGDVKGTWQWSGDPRFKTVAEVLKTAFLSPEPFGDRGITFFLGTTANGVKIVVESSIHATNTIVGISAASGNFKLNGLMEETHAFMIDVILTGPYGGRSESVAMPVFGPAHTNPDQFASAFFFTLQELVEQKKLRLPEQLLALHTTDNLEHQQPS